MSCINLQLIKLEDLFYTAKTVLKSSSKINCSLYGAQTNVLALISSRNDQNSFKAFIQADSFDFLLHRYLGQR